MEQVHHTTYIRKYRERPEDLLAVCRPCHEFLSGRGDVDPRSRRPIMVNDKPIKVVYLAGKVPNAFTRENHWRDDIWHFSFDSYIDCWRDKTVCRFSDGVELDDGRLLDYVGPYFESDAGGHGGIGMYRHAQDDENFLSIPEKCLTAIRTADLVFAWVDSLDCYGTLYELGYAFGRTTVFVAGPRRLSGLWFTYMCADGLNFQHTTAVAAFNAMLLKGEFDDDPFERCQHGSYL
jgi:hypothetical protein